MRDRHDNIKPKWHDVRMIQFASASFEEGRGGHELWNTDSFSKLEMTERILPDPT